MHDGTEHQNWKTGQQIQDMKTFRLQIEMCNSGVSSSEMMNTFRFVSEKTFWEKCSCNYNYLCLTAEYLML